MTWQRDYVTIKQTIENKSKITNEINSLYSTLPLKLHIWYCLCAHPLHDADGRRSHPRVEHLKFLFLNDKQLWQALGQGLAVRNMVSQTKPTTRLTHPNHSQLGQRQWQQVSWRMVWSLLSRRGFGLVPSRVAGDDPCVRLPEEGNIKHSTSSLWPSAILGY